MDRPESSTQPSSPPGSGRVAATLAPLAAAADPSAPSSNTERFVPTPLTRVAAADQASEPPATTTTNTTTTTMNHHHHHPQQHSIKGPLQSESVLVSSTDAPSDPETTERSPPHKQQPRLRHAAEPLTGSAGDQAQETMMIIDDLLFSVADLGQDVAALAAEGGSDIMACSSEPCSAATAGVAPDHTYPDGVQGCREGARVASTVEPSQAPRVSNDCHEKENSKAVDHVTSQSAEPLSAPVPKTTTGLSCMREDLLYLSKITEVPPPGIDLLRQARVALEASDKQDVDSSSHESPDPASKPERVAGVPLLTNAPTTEARRPTDEPATVSSVRQKGSSDDPITIGGIFDDADDDDQMQLPDFACSSVETGKRKQLASVGLASAPPRAPGRDFERLSDDRRLAIRNIVTGSPSKMAKPNPPSTAPLVEAGESSSTIQGETATAKTRVRGGKNGPKIKKPLQIRVLRSKKESDHASRLLAGQGDLAECLPPEDCLFLGDNFWIFTVEQLSFVLNTHSNEADTSSPVLLDEILSKLARSSLIRRQKVLISQNDLAATSNGQARITDEKAQPPKPDLRKCDENIAAEIMVLEPSSSQASSTVDVLISDSVAKTSDAVASVRDSPNFPYKMEVITPVSEINENEPSSSPQRALVDHHDDTGSAKSAMDMGERSDGDVTFSSAAVSPMQGSDLLATSDSTKLNPSTSAIPVLKSAEDVGFSNIIPNDVQKEASERIASWKKAVAKYQANEAEKTPADKRFRLDGAIKVLFPVATLNFLISIEVETLWNFLSMRKTETGALCGLMSIWRRECGLSPIPDLGLAKHILGVASRIEAALSAIPPVAGEDIIWMKDPIYMLTGAARDFLILHKKFTSAAKFASMKTKEVSVLLEAWRDEKGMEPLKGSGKVAMISAWKTNAKEALEAEADRGRVIDMSKTMKSTKIAHEDFVKIPYEELVSQAKPTVVEKVNKKRKRSKEKPSSGDRSVDYALYSKLFLADVLGEDVTKLLKEAGIRIAAELFDADTEPDTSSLYQFLLDSGKIDSHSAFIKTIDTWRQALRRGLDQLGKKKAFPTTNVEPLVKRPPAERKSDDVPPDGARQPSKIEVERPSSVPSSSRAVPSSSRDNKDALDAIESLSAVTKKFLSTIGIHTANDFLSSRSTDVAVEFKDWRVAEGKPELKGLGAIASVSGWKATVRKRAKDMGLDELSELEPTTKGTWLVPSKERDPRPKEADESDFFLSHSLPAVHIFPKGNGLEVDHRELLAVQHRELPGHFVFELSLRKRSDKVGCHRKLFATYKGFGPRLASSERAMKIFVQCGAADDGNTVMRQAWILANVPLTCSSATRQGNVDLRAPFSTLLPGCGLVDLSLHAAFPYKKQDLSPLKDAIGKFVADGHEATRAKIDVLVDENHNILVRKFAFDKFQYLLCLTRPVEKGQTFALEFPSVLASLNTGKYNNMEFHSMHVIDETVRSLCLHDLRALLNWLKEEALPSTGYSACLDDGVSSAGTFKQACKRRRRLYWVSRRVVAAIGDRRKPEDTEVSAALSFGRQRRTKEEEWNKLTEQQQADFSHALSAQVEVEMKYAVELDRTCGAGQRSEWCSKARYLFESVVNTVAQSYSSTPDSVSALWVNLDALLRDTVRADDFSNIGVLDDFVRRRSSDADKGSREIHTRIAGQIENGSMGAMVPGSENPRSVPTPSHFETVACIGESTSNGIASVVMRRPDDVRDGSASLSAAWYRGLFWQIVVTAVSSLEFNLESDESGDIDFEKTLSSVRSIVVEDSIEKDPLPIAFKQVLLFPTPYKVEFVPSSYEFFLGLVWPALRKQGWRLIAGSSPSEVSFCPKAQTRKRSGLLNQHRDYKKARLTNDMNLLGLGLVPKAAKRLLVAVTDNIETLEESMETDAVCDREYCVKAVLHQLRTWLIDKFAADDDFSKVFASAKIIQVVRCVENCFDSCAPMLSPIPGLPPSLKEGQGPLEAYRCEYLMQFLLLLPSALRHAELSSQDMSDCKDIVRDLLAYLAEHHKEVLEKRFHLSPEEYVGAGELQSLLEAKIRSLLAKGDASTTDGVTDSKDDELTDLVLIEDKAFLTDFVVTVLEQTHPFLATEEDVLKKSGRIQLGIPGLVCRHCLGRYKEGRYFFSSAESLATSYTVVEKHCLRCSKTPASVKERIAETRARHADQRKAMAKGLQQSFFTRLWGRFRNSKLGVVAITGGGEGSGGDGTTITLTDHQHHRKDADSFAANNEQSSDDDPIFFTDHTALLDYVRCNSSKLKNKEEVQEALDRYYSCLDYGGRVYETESMPHHFSANWLLSKVLPNPQEQHRPQRNVG